MRDSIRLLTSVLVKFDSLKEFEFTDITDDGEFSYSTDDDELRELIQALAGHSGLKKLILHASPVGRNGCVTLATFLLQNPNSKLTVLDFSDSDIDDEGVVVLATGLSETSTLEESNISSNPIITVTGMQAICAALQSPSCRLEKLSLENNELDDATAHSLSKTLTNNSTIRALDLSSNFNITITGW